MSEREIGGYIELEFPTGNEYHHEALRFNSGRNALCYYLIKKRINELFVPVYICESITDALNKAQIKYQFYHIDEKFSPLISAKEVGDTHILLVNYFGVCEQEIKRSVKKFNNKIVDSTHSFFSNPDSDVPTFYSPRKFFGVADGGYLYARGLDNDDIAHGDSAQRYMARLVRIESGAKAGYYIYRNTEQLIGRAKIRKMSVLTQNVLASIRYDMVWEKRESNFKYLHSSLKERNLLGIQTDSVHGPMVYPFLPEDENLRSYLIDKGIFVPHYWPEVLLRNKINIFESEMATKMCGLPIDQRYSIKEMDLIIHLIESYQSMRYRKEKKADLADVEMYR